MKKPVLFRKCVREIVRDYKKRKQQENPWIMKKKYWQNFFALQSRLYLTPLKASHCLHSTFVISIHDNEQDFLFKGKNKSAVNLEDNNTI